MNRVPVKLYVGSFGLAIQNTLERYMELGNQPPTFTSALDSKDQPPFSTRLPRPLLRTAMPTHVARNARQTGFESIRRPNKRVSPGLQGLHGGGGLPAVPRSRLHGLHVFLVQCHPAGDRVFARAPICVLHPRLLQVCKRIVRNCNGPLSTWSSVCVATWTWLRKLVLSSSVFAVEGERVSSLPPPKTY